MDTLEDVDSFRRSIKKHISVASIVYLYFRILRVAIVIHSATHESCIKLTILVGGWC